MKGIKVYIDESIEEKFRKAAMMVFGYSKGSLSTAAEKAFANWTRMVFSNEELFELPKNPVQTLKGMLAKTKETSVELQHKAASIRAEKILKKR